MPELESMIEQKLIDQLIYGESQWTYREDLKTEADLWANFRYILEQNNKDRLNGEPLSDSEFEQVKNQLQFSSFYKAGEWLVGENGKVQVHVQRDTEILNIVENMKRDCINTVIADFCSTWCASKDDVMYAAMHYRNGEIPNESAIKATVDYTKYKAGQEKPLPKFKYFSQMMADLRMILEEEIKPLLITV